jgi:hypothetical protein
MSIVIGVGSNRMELREGSVEIEGLRQYRIFQEGNKTPITGYDESPKSVRILVTNGIVDIVISQSSNATPYDENLFISRFIPEGYELIDTKEASKVIKGLKGKYYYCYNSEDSSYVALVTRGGGKPGRISLGSLDDKSSTLYQVLEKLPTDKPFHKAELNSLLPAKIVENRQPIKAALDILEREGYVRKTGNKIGISEEYVRSSKLAPVVGLDAHLTLDSHFKQL